MEYTAIKLLTPTSLIIVAVYLPPRKQIIPNCLHKFSTLDHFTQIIIGGDFNTRHVTWNNRRNNHNGITLRKCINKHPIHILFLDSPTYLQGKSTSMIDFFLTNLTVSSKCITKNDLSSMDLPVILDIDSTNPISLIKRFSTTDWAKYKQQCNTYNINNNIHTTKGNDSEIAKLNSKIISAFRQATDYSFHSSRSLPYIPEIHALTKKRNLARRKYQRTNNPYFKLLRNILSQQIHKIINQTKIDEWNTKLSKLNLQDNSLWNQYKILTRKKTSIPPLESSNNNIFHGDTNRADLLADTFSKIHTDSLASKSSHEEAANQIIEEMLNSNPRFNYDDFSPETINIIINSLWNNKVLGNDKITALHLKNLSKKPH